MPSESFSRFPLVSSTCLPKQRAEVSAMLRRALSEYAPESSKRTHPTAAALPQAHRHHLPHDEKCVAHCFIGAFFRLDRCISRPGVATCHCVGRDGACKRHQAGCRGVRRLVAGRLRARPVARRRVRSAVESQEGLTASLHWLESDVRVEVLGHKRFDGDAWRFGESL